jgi:hypothetical protein
MNMNCSCITKVAVEKHTLFMAVHESLHAH